MSDESSGSSMIPSSEDGRNIGDVDTPLDRGTGAANLQDPYGVTNIDASPISGTTNESTLDQSSFNAQPNNQQGFQFNTQQSFQSNSQQSFHPNIQQDFQSTQPNYQNAVSSYEPGRAVDLGNSTYGTGAAASYGTGTSANVDSSAYGVGASPYGATPASETGTSPYSAASVSGSASASGTTDSSPYASTAGSNYTSANYGGGASSYGRETGGSSPSGPSIGNKQRKKSGVKSFAWGLVGVIVGAVIAIGGVMLYENLTGSSSSSSYSGTSSNGTVDITVSGDDVTLAEAVAAKCLPSVVSIDVYAYTEDNIWNYFGMSGGDSESELEATSLGSGVIISEDGYILTNNHVIADGDMFIVHFDDDTTAEATVVGTDSTSDIAVLKVDRTGLTPMDIGDSDSVVVGEWIMALGSPFGLTKSVSQGIVAALYRNQSVELSSGTAIYANMIQIDCDINPGNSGGALVNEEGELIGINTMIATTSESSAGVGFAIPSNYAMEIANQLIENGYAVHPYLGVTLGTVDAATQEYYGTTAESGAYVVSVEDDSPAAEAGIQAGDVIVSYNGNAITTSSELIIEVKGGTVGDTVELGIVRNGEEITLSATLAADTSTTSTQSQNENQSQGLIE